MLRKLIVLAVLASFALLPTGATAQETLQFRANATGDAATNLWFFSSPTCSTDAIAFTWLDQGVADFTASGDITPTAGAVDQEFEAFGNEVYGEVYFDGGDEAFEVGFFGTLQCLSETEAFVWGTWDWGYAYEFGADALCTPLNGLGRVAIRANFATGDSSTYVQGFYTEGATGPCA